MQLEYQGTREYLGLKGKDLERFCKFFYRNHFPGNNKLIKVDITRGSTEMTVVYDEAGLQASDIVFEHKILEEEQLQNTIFFVYDKEEKEILMIENGTKDKFAQLKFAIGILEREILKEKTLKFDLDFQILKNIKTENDRFRVIFEM